MTITGNAAGNRPRVLTAARPDFRQRRLARYEIPEELLHFVPYCLDNAVPQRPADGLAGRRAGLRARSEPEWIRQLERLVGDPELRRRLGQAGCRLAETSFDHHRHLLRLGRFLRASEGEGT